LERPEVLVELMKLLAKYPPQISFPLSRKWRWFPIYEYDTKIPAGETVEVYDEVYSGWLRSYFFEINNPDVYFAMKTYSGERWLEDVATPRMLKDMGITAPNNKFPWVSLYDDAALRYVVVYAPDGFGLPFRGRSIFEFRNLTATDAVAKYFM